MTNRAYQRSAIFASVTFHTFLILGQLGALHTAFRGPDNWTTYSAMLLLLAGVLTFVYPHVGTHPRYVSRVWGQPPRSTRPWFAMLALLVIVILRARL